MAISLWRLSHLWLAILSSLFLLIASVTGLVLSFESAWHESQMAAVSVKGLTAENLISNASTQQDEILKIVRDGQGRFLAETFESGTFFMDPQTGKALGNTYHIAEVFNFCRDLHRSLFLGSIGRFIVGIVSILLLLSAVSGIWLLAQKQGGFLKAFSTRVVRNEPNRDWHTIVSRVSLPFVVIISVSAIVLFLDRFTELSDSPKSDSFSPIVPSAVDQPIFGHFDASEVIEITFPFSPDDPYLLQTEKGSFEIFREKNQVASVKLHNSFKRFSLFSFDVHTGEGSLWWSVFLTLGGISLLVLLYTGFAIYFKRRASSRKVDNPHSPADASHIVLYGSEMGSTLRFATRVHAALLESGEKSWLGSLNDFQQFPAMSHLFVLTSTYGQGEPPSNADQFLENWNSNPPSHPFRFVVLGFGSKSYPDFNAYAYAVHDVISLSANGEALMPPTAVNDASQMAFKNWVAKLSESMGVKLPVKDFSIGQDGPPAKFTLLNKFPSPEEGDDTFILELGVSKKDVRGFQSGDLLVLRWKDGGVRYYSLSVRKDRKRLLLSIHNVGDGLGSGFLARLKVGDTFEAWFQKNSHFHFPKHARKVALVANGTGIGPFLGMMESSRRNRQELQLYWGGRTQSAFELYLPFVKANRASGNLHFFETALSREEGPYNYVQDILANRQEEIAEILRSDGAILICGSLTMLAGVHQILDAICQKYLPHDLAHYREIGAIQEDCY